MTSISIWIGADEKGEREDEQTGSISDVKNIASSSVAQKLVISSSRHAEDRWQAAEPFQLFNELYEDFVELPRINPETSSSRKAYQETASDYLSSKNVYLGSIVDSGACQGAVGGSSGLPGVRIGSSGGQSIILGSHPKAVVGSQGSYQGARRRTLGSESSGGLDLGTFLGNIAVEGEGSSCKLFLHNISIILRPISFA